MGGVGHEAALRREGRVQAVQHGVESAGQPPHLAGQSAQRHALVEPAGGDALRHARHLRERAQPAPHQHAAAQHGQEHHAEAPGHEQAQQDARGRPDLIQRSGDDDQPHDLPVVVKRRQAVDEQRSMGHRLGGQARGGVDQRGGRRRQGHVPALQVTGAGQEVPLRIEHFGPG